MDLPAKKWYLRNIFLLHSDCLCFWILGWVSASSLGEWKHLYNNVGLWNVYSSCISEKACPSCRMNASIKATAGILSGKMESSWKKECQKEDGSGNQQTYLAFCQRSGNMVKNLNKSHWGWDVIKTQFICKWIIEGNQGNNGNPYW